MGAGSFASFRQSEILKASEISLDDLQRLYNLLLKINEQAMKLETEYRISIGKWKKPEKQLSLNSDQEKPIAETAIENEDEYVKMPFRIEIEGTKGEYVSSISGDILTAVSLPNDIKRIKFDNTFWCETFNNFTPVRQFTIELDFSHGPLMPVKNSSQKTENTSLVWVWGIDQVWVNGTSKIILDTLQKRKSLSYFLHTGYAYGILFWLTYFPLLTWNLIKLDTSIKTWFEGKTGALIGVFYLFLILFLMYVFKLLFDYARWLFPYMNLKEYPKHLQVAQRFLLGTIIVSIIATLITGAIIPTL